METTNFEKFINKMKEMMEGDDSLESIKIQLLGIIGGYLAQITDILEDLSDFEVVSIKGVKKDESEDNA